MMILDNYFPSPIGREEHPEWLEKMLPILDEIFRGPKENLRSDFYHNGETTYGKRSIHTEPQFAEFVKFIQERACNFLELQGYDSSRVHWNPSFFANSVRKGTTHPKHVHSQCTVSGIFYLQTPPGSANIIFHPNQPFRDFFDYMFYVKDPNNWWAKQNAVYTPYPGLLMMWPSWLYHEVPANNSEQPRTSIVFNL